MTFFGFVLILQGMYNYVPSFIFPSLYQKQFFMWVLIIISKLSKNPLLHSARATF